MLKVSMSSVYNVQLLNNEINAVNALIFFMGKKTLHFNYLIYLKLFKIITSANTHCCILVFH